MDPAVRLLTEFHLPEFLQTLIKVRSGSQPEYDEDGFATNGAPNYTRILQKLHLIVLHPGFRGRKAGNYDKEIPLTEGELRYGPHWNGRTITWGNWWCYHGRFDPTKPHQTDMNGWNSLMHACDSAIFPTGRSCPQWIY